MLTSQGIRAVKTRAMRSGVWFRLLSRDDRAILDLTMRCVEIVRSRILANTISTIIGRILNSLTEGFVQRAERIGRPIADCLVLVAEKWGRKNANIWIDNGSFVRFLGTNALNT